MSILIKEMDMPKDREILTLEINCKGKVEAYSTELKELECTPIAVEIPTPHGRLIDADELIEAHYNYCTKHHGEADVFYMWSKDLMDKAPTIIEAEGR